MRSLESKHPRGKFPEILNVNVFRKNTFPKRICLYVRKTQ